MGMDIVLYCDLADGAPKGNRTTTAQIDTELSLLATSFTVATLLAWPQEADIEMKRFAFHLILWFRPSSIRSEKPHPYLAKRAALVNMVSVIAYLL